MELVDIAKGMNTAAANIEKYGDKYAEARAQSWLLQEQLKVVKAHEMKKHQSLTIAAAEREALDSDAYHTHLKGTAAAVRAEASLRATYERWKAEFEKFRSLLSAQKAQMNLV